MLNPLGLFTESQKTSALEGTLKLGHSTDRGEGWGTCRAALQCVSSGGGSGLQTSGKSCHSICDNKMFDKTTQPSSGFVPVWTALDAQPKWNHHNMVLLALLWCQQHLNKSIQQMSGINTHKRVGLELPAPTSFASAEAKDIWKTSFKDHPKVLSPLGDYQPHSDLESRASVIKTLDFCLCVSKFQTFQPILRVSKRDTILCTE